MSLYSGMLASQFSITDLPVQFHCHYSSGLPWRFHQFTDGHWEISMLDYELREYHRLKRLQRIPVDKQPLRHLFITISFPPQYSPLFAQSLIKRLIEKKWLKRCIYYYSYEQRFDGTNGKLGDGLHVHLLLLKSRKAKSQAIREIAGTFKISPNFVDVKIGQYKCMADTRKKYIQGKKTSSKLACVQQDLKFRKVNNLRDYYTNAT